MPNGLLRTLKSRMGVGIARPSRRAFRALRRAGYTYRTTGRGGTRITGRVKPRSKYAIKTKYIKIRW